jgi:hypothetical protein
MEQETARLWWNAASTYAERCALVKRWYDLVITECGPKNSEALADGPAWDDLPETLRVDLSQDEIFA